MCGAVCVKLAHSNLGDDRADIFVTHFIIIIKLEVSVFPTVVIFSMAVCLRWLYHHMQSASYTYMYIPGKQFLSLCNLTMCANNRVYYGLMVVFVCLHTTLPHYHHSTYLKVLNFWNTCQLYFVECVSKIKSILSIIFHAICGAVDRLCVVSLPRAISLVMTVRISVSLYYYYHQIRSMNHLPWNAVYLPMFLFTIRMFLCGYNYSSMP